MFRHLTPCAIAADVPDDRISGRNRRRVTYGSAMELGRRRSDPNRDSNAVYTPYAPPAAPPQNHYGPTPFFRPLAALFLVPIMRRLAARQEASWAKLQARQAIAAQYHGYRAA
jgi:hypothetical protein